MSVTLWTFLSCFTFSVNDPHDHVASDIDLVLVPHYIIINHLFHRRDAQGHSQPETAQTA